MGDEYVLKMTYISTTPEKCNYLISWFNKYGITFYMKQRNNECVFIVYISQHHKTQLLVYISQHHKNQLLKKFKTSIPA